MIEVLPQFSKPFVIAMHLQKHCAKVDSCRRERGVRRKRRPEFHFGIPQLFVVRFVGQDGECGAAQVVDLRLVCFVIAGELQSVLAGVQDLRVNLPA